MGRSDHQVNCLYHHRERLWPQALSPPPPPTFKHPNLHPWEASVFPPSRVAEGPSQFNLCIT